MDHDFDPVVRDAEEEVGLDQLQSLVGERGRVDRDLRTHAPRRVGERVVHRHALELVAAAAAEGPSGGGQHERVDRTGVPTLEALEERGVLRVDGQQSSSTPLLRGERERSGGDEALLVRKRERDAALERPERRADAGEADDAFRTTSGSAASSSPVTSPPTCVCATPCSRASAVRSDEPDARAQSSSSGFRSTTSIACRPIEPVAPSSAIRFTVTVCPTPGL